MLNDFNNLPNSIPVAIRKIVLWKNSQRNVNIYSFNLIHVAFSQSNIFHLKVSGSILLLIHLAGLLFA